MPQNDNLLLEKHYFFKPHSDRHVQKLGTIVHDWPSETLGDLAASRAGNHGQVEKTGDLLQ